MGALGTAIPLFLAFVVHYGFNTLTVLGKGDIKVDDLYERSRKLYLYGIAALLSMHFTSTFGAVFAWLTFFALTGFYVTLKISDEEKKKRLTALSSLIYMSLLAAWWLGQTVIVFTIKVDTRK